MEEKIFQYPNINETAFSINLLGLNLNVQWYGLSYIADILFAWYFMAKLVKNKDLWFGNHSIIERSEVDDLITYMILGIVIGGRLGYCLFYAPGYYFENPIRTIYVWEGGMSFHGGFLGVIMSGALFGVRKRINLLSLGDLIAFASPPGLFFGRIANFINGELWGKPTTSVFGITTQPVEKRDSFEGLHFDVWNNGKFTTVFSWDTDVNTENMDKYYTRSRIPTWRDYPND